MEIKSVNVEEFFTRISKLVKIKGSYLVDLHKKTLFTKTHYYYCINHKTIPSIEILISIADYFNISLNYLLWGKDHNFDDDEIVFLVKIRQLPDRNKVAFYEDLCKLIEEHSKID